MTADLVPEEISLSHLQIAELSLLPQMAEASHIRTPILSPAWPQAASFTPVKALPPSTVAVRGWGFNIGK